jgi:hypothetical protein
LLGSVLLTLAFSPPTRAGTTNTVDDHLAPVTLAVGEPATVRYREAS